MGLLAPKLLLSCPLCTRASYLWDVKNRSSLDAHFGVFFKMGSKGYCPSCGVLFTVNPIQILCSYFKKLPPPPVVASYRREEPLEIQSALVPIKGGLDLTQQIMQVDEEPSGVHLRIKSKSIGLKIEMSVTGGKMPEKIGPLLSSALSRTSEACALLFRLCGKKSENCSDAFHPKSETQAEESANESS